MLLMVKKEGGTCHTIHRYAKANNKHMKSWDENEESTCMQYLGADNQYRWVMSQKLPVIVINGKKYIEIWWNVYKKLRWK